MKNEPVTKKLPEFNPTLVEMVERKLDAYRDRLSPAMLEHFREEALVLLSTHPYPAALLKQLTPPTVVQHSTTVPTGDAAPADESATSRPRREEPKRGRGGGR